MKRLMIKPAQVAHLSLLVLAYACGPMQGKVEKGPTEALPDILTYPLPLSAVAIGSRDVTSAPAPGISDGVLLVELQSEPDAKIVYSFDDFASSEDATPYEHALTLVPPVTIYAQASKDDVLGPKRTFAYKPGPNIAPAAVFMAERLPLTASTPLIAFDPSPRVATVSSSSLDSTGPKRLTATDALFDMPPYFAAVDLTKTEVTYDVAGGQLTTTLFTRDAPSTNSDCIYGFEIGPSNITTASFGKGATFLYRVELRADVLAVTQKDPKSKDATVAVKLSEKSLANRDKSVTFSLQLDDLPLLKGAKELSLRPYAVSVASSTPVYDRIEPIFLGSRFDLARLTSALSQSRNIEINFLSQASDAAYATGEPNFAKSYLALSATLLKELEGFLQIPVYHARSIPLFYVSKEESGYAGLNTSDRGILTTLGPNTSLIAKAQLMAHEMAHFQNARDSQLEGRWLQEGMSEWASERLLYRHFPARAVHKYLTKLRFDRYFAATATKGDHFPLEIWDQEVSSFGYEKSLMFMDLLEAELGIRTLKKAFQRAVNQPLDSAGFKRFLEAESGRDLSSLFKFWVTKGDVDEAYSPAAYFDDSDGDGLLAIDEKHLGTDPTLRDTDGDGVPDGEEYFRGLDALVSNLPAGVPATPQTPVLANAEDTDTNALFRLGGSAAATHFISFNPFATHPTIELKSPLYLQPPYSVAVQTNAEGLSGAVTLLSRPLFIGGTEQSANAAARRILPLTPLSTTPSLETPQVASEFDNAANLVSAADRNDDLPHFLSPYDVTGISLSEEADVLKITIATVSEPSPFGDYGDYTVQFDLTSWSNVITGTHDQGPGSERPYVLTLTGGAPYLQTGPAGSSSTALLNHGVTTNFAKTSAGGQIVITLAKANVPGFTDSTDERQVCVNTQLELESAYRFKDGAGCVSYAGDGIFGRRIGQMNSSYGDSKISLVLSTTASSFSDTEKDHFLTVGLNALRAFERELGRPLFDRSIWPLHLSSGSGVVGSATQKAGAYLRLDPALSATAKDYLFIEQLSRLHMADLLDRLAGRDYWLQEIYIQWLAASALYQIAPTRDVHAYLKQRLDSYRNYINNPGNCCSGNYSSEVTLQAWNSQTLTSTGSVKSLIFVLRLDALVGSDVLSKVFSTYANAAPDSDMLKALVKGYAPTKSAAIDELWMRFVTGSGNAASDTAAVMSQLVDGDGDGLFLFEEESLSKSDASVDAYLN